MVSAEYAELANLYGQTRRALHWAAFLLGMMALILIIDLQLKKSIAKQAVDVAKWLGEVRYGGPAPGTSDSAAADAGGPDGVDRDAGLAAPDGTGPDTATSPQDNGVDGQAFRTSRDGRRARRAPGSG